MPISCDLHGIEIAYFLCPGFPNLPCAPAILQAISQSVFEINRLTLSKQEYISTFVATLSKTGGNSAYVPTTRVYSSFEEIMQPQENTDASAYVLDESNVGVSNTELLHSCVA